MNVPALGEEEARAVGLGIYLFKKTQRLAVGV
jgi:hypothetical protein